MRGRTLFPKDPSTKPSIIYVYCESAKVKEALAAGATQAGGEELLDKVCVAAFSSGTTRDLG